jgi:hypothetical protein
MEKSKIKQSSPTESDMTGAGIASLIVDLDSPDGLVRVKARKSLAAVGGRAVNPLVDKLVSKQEWARWEAAKTLGQIRDVKAMVALIKALEDKLFDVRWLAAQGLIAMGREVTVPLLRALVKSPDSRWLQEGVHHVLHDLYKGKLAVILQPVITALESFEPSIEAPLAAEEALKKLKKIGITGNIDNEQSR